MWLGAKRYAEYCKHRLKTWLNNGKEKVSVYSVTFTCPSNGFGFKVIDKPGKPGTAPFLSEITPGKAAARAGKIRNGHEIVSIGCDGKPQKDTSNFSLQDMRAALKRAEALKPGYLEGRSSLLTEATHFGIQHNVCASLHQRQFAPVAQS